MVNSGADNVWVCLSYLISIFQGQGLNSSFCHKVTQIKRMLNIIMGCYICVKWKKHDTLTWPANLIHSGLMYGTELLWSGSTNMLPDSCVLGVNTTLLVIKDTLVVVV